MAKPYFYVNVSQTIAVSLLGVSVISYILNIRGFRTDVNSVLTKTVG